MARKRPIARDGASVLKGLWTRGRRVLLMLFFFSFLINILMLVGPVYMLQIYDRVLSSGSDATLIYLTVAAIGLLAAVGALEHVRSETLIRLGSHVNSALDRRLFKGVLSSLNKQRIGNPGQPMRDLDTVNGFFSGQALTGLMDAPWVPLFLFVIFLMHPVLGIVATGGALLLAVLVALTEIMTRTPLKEAAKHKARSQDFLDGSLRSAQAIEAMGMSDRLLGRWLPDHKRGAAYLERANERTGMIRAGIKFLRPSLQAAMLGIGAYLALRDAITPGVIVAASIISGRALAPIEQAIGSWKQVIATRDAYGRLREFLLRHCAGEKDQVPLPRPTGKLSVEHIVGGPPGSRAVVVKNVSFKLEPGEFLGITGPSGAGKSTLANLLVGVWKPLNGCARLDGADMAEWDKARLGQWLGYLPQAPELFEGTVAENIARFSAIRPDAVLEASQLARVHDFVLRLPKGYESSIGPAGVRLSAGQRQRLALARAIYGKPPFIVLDEPNSNLDADGEAALIQTLKDIRQHGSTVVMICHRASLLALADKIMVMKDGHIDAMGPADEMLRRMVGIARKGNAKSPQGKSPHGKGAPVKTKPASPDAPKRVKQREG